MLVQQLLETTSTAVEWGAFSTASYELAAPVQGEDIADGLQTFFAPLAAVLIGIVALKFLFGENKSLAAFIGFMILAVVVYSLIQFGDTILQTLAETVNSWIGG